MLNLSEIRVNLLQSWVKRLYLCFKGRLKEFYFRTKLSMNSKL